MFLGRIDKDFKADKNEKPLNLCTFTLLNQLSWKDYTIHLL